MQNLNRRTWAKAVVAGAAGSLILPSTYNLYGQEGDMALPEEHMGDPEGLKAETLSFNVKTAEAPLTDYVSRGPYKEGGELSKLMVKISVAYADKGVSRTYQKKSTDKKGHVVDNFLKLFGLNLRYDSGTYVPFCAAGLSFAACEAYCQINPEVSYNPDKWQSLQSILTDINKYYFKPSPAVRVIKKSAEDRGQWVKPAGVTPKEGWPVVFSWKKDGTPNHIGLVRHLDGKTLHTVEYNTSSTNDSNGGKVAVRERNIDFVLGYVDTYKKPAP
jgi:hypothetical protein